MKKIVLQVIRARDVSVPPLVLDDLDITQWFDIASGFKIEVTTRDRCWDHDSRDCDASLLQEILRWAIPGPVEERPVDEIALIFCRNWKAPSGVRPLLGVMFDFDMGGTPYGDFQDPNSVPRQGCAVFISAFAERPDKDIVFAAIHELGHVFNLAHDPRQASFMADGVDPQKPLYRFDPADRSGLNKAGKGIEPFASFHLPGGAAYQGTRPFLVTRRPRPPAKRASRSLKLTADVGKKGFLLGETVTVDMVLSARRGKRVMVPPGFDPGDDACRIWYETPSGERLLYRREEVFCRDSRQEVQVTPSRPLKNNPRISFGRKGFTFREPGRYRLWAEFFLSGSGRDVVRSRPVTFTILPPRDKSETAISRTLLHRDVAKFVCRRGSVLPAAVRRRIETIAKRYPEHDAVQPVLYALASHHLHARNGRHREARKYVDAVRVRQRSLKEGLRRMRRSLPRKKVSRRR